MAGRVTIRLVQLASGQRTPFDGGWLVEYDPTRPGVDPAGRPMTAHIVVTRDRGKARTFADAGEAMRYWRQGSGLPYPRNRPLTAWTATMAALDADDDLP